MSPIVAARITELRATMRGAQLHVLAVNDLGAALVLIVPDDGGTPMHVLVDERFVLDDDVVRH